MSKFYTGTKSGTVVGTAALIGTWTSKTFTFDKEVTIYSCRVWRTGTGDVTVSVNGGAVVSTPISGQEYAFAAAATNTSTKFYVTVTRAGDATVEKVEIYEQKIVDVKETTVITARDVDTWRKFTIRHPMPDAPCFVYATALDGGFSTDITIDGLNIETDGRVNPSATKSITHIVSVDTDNIESLTLYIRSTIKVPKHIHIVNDGPVPPWLIERYEVPDKSQIASIQVFGSGNTNIRLRYGGTAGAIITQALQNGVESQPSSRTHFGSLEFDFDGNDSAVSSVHIFLVEEVTVDGPVYLDNPEHEQGHFFNFKNANSFVVQKVFYMTPSGGVTSSILRLTDAAANFVQKNFYTGVDQKLKSATLWPLIDTPNNGIIREAVEVGDCPPWEYKRFVFDKPRIITSFTVSGSTDYIYINGVAIAPAASNQETPTNFSTPTRYCTVKATNITDAVTAISIFTKEVIDVDEKGFTKVGGDNWVNLYLSFAMANRFVCGKVMASGAAATLIVDGVTALTALTNGGGLLKLPRSMAKTVDHKISVNATHPEMLTLLPRTVQAVKGNKVRVVNDGFIPEWMHTKYELEGTDRLTSVYVKGASSINLYLDGAEGATVLPVTDGVEMEIAKILSGGVPITNGRCSAFEFDFTNDSAVTEVIFWADPMRIIGQDDIILEGEDHWMGRRFKFPDRGEWACVSVGADASVAMTLTCDDTPASNQSATLADGFMVALPRDREGSAWTLSLDAGGEKVYNFVAKARTRMPVNETLVRITGQRKEIHPWWYGRWDIPADRRLTGIIIDADDSVSGTLYLMGANETEREEPFTASSNNEIRVLNSSSNPYNDVCSVDIAFTAGSEYKVNEAFLVFQQERLCPPDGIVLENEVSWRSLRFSFQEKNRFAVAAVKAENYISLVMDVYRNGSLSASIDISNGNPVLIPVNSSNTSDPDHVQWEVDLYYRAGSPNGNINSLTLKPFITRAIEDDTYVMKQKGQIAEWLYARWELPKKQRIRSCYVSTNAANPAVAITPYPTLTTIRTRTPAYKETTVSVPACGAFTFQVEDEFAPGTLVDVDDVILHMERHVPIENRHTIMRDVSPREGIRNRVYRFPDTGSFCAIRVVADDIIFSKFTADATTDIITHTNADIANLSRVRLTSTQALPLGLSTNTDYYVIALTSLTCKLATSYANASAASPTAVNITSAGTGIHTIHDAAVINVTPYAGDVAQKMIEVTNDELTDLDQNMPNAREWAIDIESTFTIREIHLLTKEEEPYNGWSWIVKRDQAPWSWRHHRTVASRPMEFACARILADVYPLELQVFNIDNGLVFSYSVSNAQPFRLRKEQPGRVWRIDVLGAPDSRIFEVGLSTSMKGLLNAAPPPR